MSLSVRDRDLLMALARFGIARTSDLTRLCFPDVRRDTAASRLRRLFDSRYLDVRVSGRNEENLYTLGPLGRKLLGGLDVPLAAVPRGGHDHHLAIVRTWIALATNGLGLELVRARPDWEIREENSLAPGRVIPDLLVVLRHGGETLTLAIEVDLGTERLIEIRGKIRRYKQEAWAGSDRGDSRLAVGVVVRSTERARNVGEVLKADFPGLWAVWCEADGPAAALTSLFDLRRTPLTGSPYGKGTVLPVTPHASPPTGSDDGRL